MFKGELKLVRSNTKARKRFPINLGEKNRKGEKDISIPNFSLNDTSS